MHIVYAPEGNDPQVWEFDADKVRSSVCEQIERTYGENYDAWATGVQRGNARARRVLLWHLTRLDHPTLKYTDTPDFLRGELKVSYAVDELAAMRARVLKADVTDDQRQAALVAIDIDMTEAMEREAVDAPGKAPSPTSDADGGATSLPS